MSRKMKKFTLIFLIALLIMPTGWLSAFAEEATGTESETETVYHETFENDLGLATQSGDSQLEAVSDVVFDGNDDGYALHVTGRTNNWDGVDISFADVGMEDGQTYDIKVTGYVDESVSVPEGGQALLQNIDSYDGLYLNANYVAGEPFTLEGQYTVNVESDSALRIQSNDAGQTVPFYIGNILITTEGSSESDGPEIPEGEGIAVYTDFEDGSLQGWEPREGVEELSVNAGTGKDSEYSLLIENRQGTFYSAKLDFLENMYEGYTYDISVWVKLAPGEEPTELQVSRAETDADGTNYWPPVVTPKMVTDEEWVLLEGTYTLSSGVNDLFFYVEEPYDPDQSSGVSFYLDDFKAEAQIQDEIEDIPELKEVFADYFDIGAAIERDQMFGRHGEMLQKHYNMLVAENVMKPEAIQPNEGEFSWSRADAMLDFAEENGMKTRFHTLVWHSQSPSWMFNDADGNPMVVGGEVADPDNLEENKQLLLDRIEDHIVAVVDRYHDRIDSWDVVNEVIVAHESDGYRRSEYYLITGSDFIRHAFEITARELEKHNASGKLYYNDYSTHSPQKRDLIYDMILDLNLVEDGLIDGVGHQTHINIEYPPMSEITDSIEKFAELGLDNEITELDVSIYTNDNQNYDGFDNIPAEVLETQAERYKELFNEFRRLKDHISSVVFWGIGDDHTWLHDFPVSGRTNAPFVFDHNLQAKPAYWAIIEEPQEEEEEVIPSLYQFYEEHFQIGAAIELYQMEGPHGEMLDYHYNSIVAENIMKPAYIQPSEGEFNFSQLDQMMQYAQDHDLSLRYHTLLWHSQSPDWFHEDENGDPLEATEENKQLVLDRVETHVDTVVRHIMENYPGVVDSWDVVNEVVNPNGPEGMRESEWYRLTGTDFIATAFRTAKSVLDEYGDDSKLYINDYNTHEPAKRDALFDLVMELTADGVPIDGVGHQTHVNIRNPHINLITDSIELFANEGFDIQITELDVSIYTDDTTVYETFDDIPEEIFVLQAERYKQLFDEFVRMSDSISNVTFWGIGDDHTWLTDRPIPRQNAPFVFDHNLQPKLAFWALVDPSRLPELKQEANSTYGTPEIDGEKELLWETTVPVTIGAGEALSASFKTTWDENHLYLWAEVSDEHLHEDDALEVFIVDGEELSHSIFARGSGSTDEVSISEIDGGYIVEAMIPLTNGLTEGDQVAFDLRVLDGETYSFLSWNDLTHEQETSGRLGTLSLLPEVNVSEAIYGTPEINAEFDDIWENANELSTDVWVEGSEGSTAVVRTLWDEENLYVYADVTDSYLSKESANVWEQDSIEVFVDQNNAKTEYYQADDGQFRVNYENEQSYGGYANADTFETATRLTEDGYVVEAAISLTDIDPAEGTIIGFDIQVNNDENGDGSRDSIAIWNDPTGQSYQNTSRFGVLRFSNLTEEDPPTLPTDPDLEDLERFINELIDYINDLERRLAGLEDVTKEQLDELKKELELLERLMAGLLALDEELRDQLASFEQAIADLRKMIESLEAQLEDIEDEKEEPVIDENEHKEGQLGSGSDDTTGESKSGGQGLPDTATNYYTILFFGLFALLAGIVFTAIVSTKRRIV
ncbi:endo-1,4-beta-xylanase [Halalkalibacter sp. APA_J-10(15)]|uniref:endo-1,4-beta-xylanase n=1 Tax=Halalkalibacter sp. APA_J-10(15) TaxID=2933805 RepID=UPI001FF4BC9E|nr:endo-1,4-beta-xylanase [Halalkalibacter sp. APA_J-10(15)]MCK0470483.1 endo-1,4-beta-xylanase [Halalkalibacter sp. APA_J-10(15)]